MAASLFLRFYCRKVTTSRLTALCATEELLCVHELSKRNHIQICTFTQSVYHLFFYKSKIMRLSCLVEARVLFEENRLFVVVGRKYVACPNSVNVQIHAIERKLYLHT